MRLLRFGTPGAEAPGILDMSNRIRDLSSVIPDLNGEALSEASLSRIRAIDPETLPLASPDVRIGPCVAGISKIIGVGMNYSDHAEEINAPLPKHPILFSKPPSSICGPYDDILRPKGSEKLDWEVELAVVIGRTAANVTREASMDHVAGFCLFNDITERGWIEASGQMINGKSADTFSPLGPWLVTPDEIPDVKNLELFLEVNGERRQRGNTRTMIFDIPTLISHISGLMTLQPGDVITTGTPPGVGMRMNPPCYLQPGDKMRLGIAGLGEQSQAVCQR
ncbi:fumarylacetoacetate hydrolase family protein [Telmatospirillum sp. J64-1]|uniref:fumarylacetoacetate hydrolase family protein n=1 Tax=Telmatospirillum sp. J64-1 TaxID=2502183 RepID=UPI00115D6EF5|nr:fumarylacetoacetate hydrolase family protein [Telmatospirillum sp. J64-1]